MSLLYSLAQKERAKLLLLINELEVSLADAPEGFLRFRKSGKKYKFFFAMREKPEDDEPSSDPKIQKALTQSSSHEGPALPAEDPSNASAAQDGALCLDRPVCDPSATKQRAARTKYREKYIRREDVHLAVRLAKKMLDMRLLRLYRRQLAAVERFLSSYPDKDATDVFSSLSAVVVQLLGLKTTGLNEAAAKWASEEYVKSDEYPEDLKQRAEGGLMVRSKSEAIIVAALRKFGLFFRYECEFWNNGRRIFPDFMIMDPRTGEIVIWEHFGRMDRPGYRKTWEFKHGFYSSAGYFPGVNMICTYESEDHPLDPEYVEATIRSFFMI